MFTVDEALQNDAGAFIAAFGESVVYTPANGTPRTILAIVDRSVPERAPGGGAMAPKLTITVANNATTGISTATLDAAGNDRVTVAIRYGGTPVSLGVYLPPAGSKATHDAGMVQLDLR